ncbi:MAG: hypothetical protein V3R80_02560, partial [Candidatus Tectomicrobia bacterium]
HQALQEEGLDIEIAAATVHRLQQPATILAAKHAIGGPEPQALAAELDQLNAFVATQHQAWQARGEALQAKSEACRQLA